jgi:hypothetical protein
VQVCGGLVTGCVVKYCNNVLKNFALAVSVILTVLVSIPLFGQVGVAAVHALVPAAVPMRLCLRW